MKKKSAPLLCRGRTYSPRFWWPILLDLALSLQVARPATVSVCDEAGLRTALAAGGVVTFGCDGVIVLSSTVVITTNTVLNGSGRQVTLSGNGTVRVFQVNTGASLALLNLTIANGYSTNGGGIYNDNGTLTLVNCVCSNNWAAEAAGLGGTNGLDYPQAVGSPGGTGNDGASACGGAIFNTGRLLATNTLFVSNTVQGGPGGDGGNGGAGATYPDHPGTCAFAGGAGGNGGVGGNGLGGGLYSTGEAWLSSVEFSDNRALGGMGGAGGIAGLCSVLSSSGNGGAGGEGSGAAIYNAGWMQLTASTAANNEAQGGLGGTAGPFIYSSYEYGGAGGAGQGGAIYSTGTNVMVNVTLAGNSSGGGNGGLGAEYSGLAYMYNGPGGNAYGGGVCNLGECSATNCTLWNNVALAGYGTNAQGGIPGSNGQAFAASLQTTGALLTLMNTIVGNLAFTNNCLGALTDAGYNLCSDASAGFTVATSMNNTDPRLGPLARNGGLTRTLALQAGSPAIDRGDDASCPPADQRGVPRPQAAHSDIGAFEQTFLTRVPGQNFQLIYAGVPGLSYMLQGSTDLENWDNLQTVVAAPNGVVVFQQIETADLYHFFRTQLMP